MQETFVTGMTIMIQFKEEEIYRLIQACSCYQEKTGSDYMFVKFQQLKEKLEAYKAEIETN